MGPVRTGAGVADARPPATCGRGRTCAPCGGPGRVRGPRCRGSDRCRWPRARLRTAAVRGDRRVCPPLSPLRRFPGRCARARGARWQAAAVGGGDVLHAPGQALPEMKEGAVGVAVQREVVDPRYSGCDERGRRYAHHLGVHGAPRKRNADNTQHPGSAPASQEDSDLLDHALQQRSPPLVALGQPRHLFGERHLRAGRILAVQTAHTQVDPHGPSPDCGICEVTYITAGAPLIRRTTPRTGRRDMGVRTGMGPDHRTREISRGHQDVGQVRYQSRQFDRTQSEVPTGNPADHHLGMISGYENLARIA